MKSNKVISGLFWVYLENISVQVVNFIISIILARLLEPSHYGIIALLLVFISLAKVFVTSGISSALIQKKDADDLDYSTMFWFNLIVAFILYGILFFCAPSIGRYYENDELSLVLRVFALSIPLSAFNCIQQAYVSSHMIFKKSFISNSGGVLLSGLVGIVLAYCGFGVWALVVQQLLCVALNTLFLKLIIKWKPQWIFSFERLKPMFSFGWKMMVTGFLFTGYTELRSLIIGKRYSSADLGFYDRGYSFPRLVASNIDSTITRVLFPALSNEQNEKTRLAEKTRRAGKTSAYIMTPILWGLAMIAHPLVLLLLGEKWLPCVPYLQIMCIVWWLQPTQTCSAQAIKAIGRSDLYLYIEIISKIIGLGLLAYAVLIINTVKAIAVMFLVGQVIAVFIYGGVSAKYIGYKIGHQIIDLLIPALLSTVMCAYVFLMSRFVQNDLICMSLQIVGGGLVYMVCSIITNNDSYKYIISTLGLKKRKDVTK